MQRPLAIASNRYVRTVGGVLVALALALSAGRLAGAARAQPFNQYQSADVPGFDVERGAEILRRPRTEYDPLGVKAGIFTIRPRLDESVSFDSNVLGSRPSTRSSVVGSAPQVDIESDLGRNALGASFGLNNESYFDQRRQSRTDWNGSVGSTIEIGADTLTFAVKETYQHEVATDLDSATITQPLGYKVTDARVRYDTDFLRWHFEPNFQYINYRFDDLLLPGAALSQKARDRDSYVGGLTTHFGDYHERSFVLVLRASDTHFVANLGGVARPDSMGYEALGGLDYAFSGNLRGLLLVGYEVRQFTSSFYPTRSSPVAQAAVMWTPTGLTTLTLRAQRSIEDTIGETTTGVTQSQGSFTIDHEYQRNWLLQGRGSINNAEYGQNIGHETLFGLGAGVTYLFNRQMRLTGMYDFTSRTGTPGAISIVPLQSTPGLSFGDYDRHIATINLRFAL